MRQGDLLELQLTITQKEEGQLVHGGGAPCWYMKDSWRGPTDELQGIECSPPVFLTEEEAAS